MMACLKHDSALLSCASLTVFLVSGPAELMYHCIFQQHKERVYVAWWVTGNGVVWQPGYEG